MPLDQELRELEKRLLEDGHGDLVQWVRGLMAVRLSEDLDDPPLWAETTIAPHGTQVVDVWVPASEGLRNGFEWSGLSLIPWSATTREDLETWRQGKVAAQTTMDGKVIEFPLRLALAEPSGLDDVTHALSDHGKPMIRFRPIKLLCTSGVRFEVPNHTADTVSVTVVIFGRRTGKW